MIVHLIIKDGIVHLLIRAESDDGTILGDGHTSVRAGETFDGWTYEELLALGDGEHDIEQKSVATP
jgi:hypothetical protein